MKMQKLIEDFEKKIDEIVQLKIDELDDLKKTYEYQQTFWMLKRLIHEN